MSKRTYQGRCHCGAVRFEADIDWSAGTLKCNCTICTKTRVWGVVVAGVFRLTEGHETLQVYRFGSQQMAHCFCRHCGVHPFAQGSSAAFGGAFTVVHVNCLDGLHWPDALAAPLHIADGRNDDFSRMPDEIQHL